MYVYIYTQINLLSLYNHTCKCVFRDHHLSLDNQLVCSPLGKIISPDPSFLQLPVILCTGLRLMDYSYF